MEESERAREYERFTEPPDVNRLASTWWRAEAALYRRQVSHSSPEENRERMREIEGGIAELESEPDDPEAPQSLHQLKAMWFWAYEAATSSAASHEK